MQSISRGTIASRSPPPEIVEAKENLALPSTRRDIPTHLSNDEDERVNVAVIPLECQTKWLPPLPHSRRKVGQCIDRKYGPTPDPFQTRIRRNEDEVQVEEAESRPADHCVIIALDVFSKVVKMKLW